MFDWREGTARQSMSFVAAGLSTPWLDTSSIERIKSMRSWMLVRKISIGSITGFFLKQNLFEYTFNFFVHLHKTNHYIRFQIINHSRMADKVRIIPDSADTTMINSKEFTTCWPIKILLKTQFRDSTHRVIYIWVVHPTVQSAGDRRHIHHRPSVTDRYIRNGLEWHWSIAKLLMTIPADSRTRNLMNNSISINAKLLLHVTNPNEREWQRF